MTEPRPPSGTHPCRHPFGPGRWNSFSCSHNLAFELEDVRRKMENQHIFITSMIQSECFLAASLSSSQICTETSKTHYIQHILRMITLLFGEKLDL